jgi:hypothetical protein
MHPTQRDRGISRLLSSLVGVLLGLGACSATAESSIQLVTGEEIDVFSRAPQVVDLIVEKVSLEGSRTELSRVKLPSTSLDLGSMVQRDVGALSITGLDAAGAPVLRGDSLFVQWGALEHTSLEVFVQRTQEFARLPRGPSVISRERTAILASRYVLTTTNNQASLYDLLRLTTLAPRTLPRVPKSLVTRGTSMLLLDETSASLVDLETGAVSSFDAPSGGAFAEAAGGSTFSSSDGTQFIVGATRTNGGPSARILIVDPSGRTSFASLNTPREGACAAYVEGRGLVVFGGSSGPEPIEVLAPGATTAAVLAQTATAPRGCSATALDGAHVALAGGIGAEFPVTVVDLACTGTCPPTPWRGAIPLVRSESLALLPDAIFLVGEDLSGVTRAFRASSAELREIPLRTPRRGGKLLRSPTGAMLVVGGAPGIEQYVDR